MIRTLIVSVILTGCTVNNYYVYGTSNQPEEDTAPPDTPSGSDIEDVPGYTSATCAASPDEFTASVWETDSVSYHFEVSIDQLEQMNEDWYEGWWDYYVYNVNEDAGLTFADPVCITDPTNGVAANFGQVQLKLTGQSTGVEWASDTIPPLSVDVGEFVDNQTLGADETRWLAFHPGTISYIFSEPVAYAVLAALGEPVPRTSLAWVSSNVWGNEIRIPYNTVEKYKEDWCADHADQLGGGCVNVWEGWGDFLSWYLPYLTADCELSNDCDDTRFTEFLDVLDEAPYDDSFEESTEGFVDWTAVKRSICGSWMLWIGDDPFHNTNNVVTVEQADGKFRLLYYSIDLSAGASGWYEYTTLNGWNTLAYGCYSDRECWESTLNTCEGMIRDFEKADPVGTIDSFWERLQVAGMARDGDADEYERIRAWYETRVIELPEELSCYRDQYEQWSGGEDTGYDTGYLPSDTAHFDSSDSALARGGGWDTGGSGWYDCAYLMDDYL